MNSSLTVADLYTALKPNLPTSAGGNGVNGGTPGTINDFIPYLNQTLERVINSGTWEGSIAEVLFNGSTGFITLPYQFQSIVGAEICGWPQQVWSKFTEYVEVGPGRIRSDLCGIGPLIESAETACVNFPISLYGAGGSIKVTITNVGDAGKAFWFEGKRLDGSEIFYSATGAQGTPYNSVFPSGNLLESFSVMSNIVAPSNMLGVWRLYVTIGGTDYLLGTYDPQNYRPNYKRYKTGTWDTSREIATLCRRKYIPVRFGTDFIIPDNIGGLRFGLRAVFAEGANRDADMADALWARCYNLLNQQHRASRGKASYIVNFNPHGAGNYPIMNSH